VRWTERRALKCLAAARWDRFALGGAPDALDATAGAATARLKALPSSSDQDSNATSDVIHSAIRASSGKRGLPQENMIRSRAACGRTPSAAS